MKKGWIKAGVLIFVVVLVVMLVYSGYFSGFVGKITGQITGKVEEGLVAWYKFDNNFEDSAGKNDGAGYGTRFVIGKVKNAVEFDGEDYIRLDSYTLVKKEKASITFWVRPAFVGKSKGLLSHEKSGSFYSHIEIGNKQLLGETIQDCNTFNFNAEKTNQWTFYAIIFNNSKAYLYRNNEYAGEADYGTDGCGGDSVDYLVKDFKFKYMGVGTHYSGAFEGALDELKIWDKALTEKEVKKEYGEEVCEDSCSSLGYECGKQVVCKEEVNCGDCEEGKVCVDGKCVVKEEIEEEVAKSWLERLFEKLFKK